MLKTFNLSGDIKFIAGVTGENNLPKFNLPEIAFAGKSNVGKSSLINLLLGRKNLARISNTPGRTRQLNFFSVNDKFIIVDLPGYGYAKVSNKVKLQWERLILSYFKERSNLKLVNLLIDSRRGLMNNDIEMLRIISFCNLNFQVVLTKIDKVNQVENLCNLTKKSLESLGHSCSLIYTSCRSKEGARELRISLEKYVSS